MKTRILVVVGLLVAIGPVATLHGFEVLRTRTQADLLASDPGADGPVIQLNFTAELSGRPPDLLSSAMVTNWQDAGGIEPTPFQVHIPAGCFVQDRGFQVEDFRGCGVALRFRDQDLPIVEFRARLVRLRDGTARFDLRALVGGNPPDDGAPILSALGGAEVTITVGSDAAPPSPPFSIDSLSGIQPCV
jgi:hypothetical protein